MRSNSQGWFTAFCYAIYACILAAFIHPYIVISEFKEDLKSDIIPKVMKTFETIKHTTNSDIISENELMKSNLFSRFNHMDSGDSFRGTFNGVSCKILETELGVQGTKGYVPCFKGVIISFKLNKKINAKTIIITKNNSVVGNGILPRTILYMISPTILILLPYIGKLGDPTALANLLFLLTLYLILVMIILTVYYIIKKIQCIFYNLKIKQIKLEDPKFAKKFRVFSEDEVEARYLITHSFMERFLNLITSLGSNKAKCAFYNDKVMFAISTSKDLFEFWSLFKPIDDPKNIGFFNEIFSILDMIDYFNLDKKIGL